MVLAGVSCALMLGQARTALASGFHAAQTFPVSYVVAKQPVPLARSSATSFDEGGLQVSEHEQSVMTYSDLRWTKEEYRDWTSGRAFHPDNQMGRSSQDLPLSFRSQPVAPRSGTMDHWQLGDRYWRYALDDGLGVRLGSAEVGSSVLAGSATLGGIHIKQSTLAQHDDVADWSVSLAIGALDYSSNTGNGDLAYGPTAANTVIHYGLGDHVALESGVQLAPGLVTTSLGGRFDAHDWGLLRAGVAHGGLDEQQGWRYQASYDVKLSDDLLFSLRNEWDAPGFSDLGHYRNGVTAGVRRHWKATVPTRRWGDISGSYESFRPEEGTPTQRFGFSQQFWYSPNLRIGLQAHRELVSGDYDIGIRFSVPIN